MKTSGNTILITGGTDGIGEALAEKFLALGNTVIVVGRNKDKLTELAHRGFVTYGCDVARMDELERLSLLIQQEHSNLNVLINNAGIQYNYNFTEELHLINKIDHEVAVNFLGPLRLTALLLPILKLNENSAVINVSSGLGLVPKKQAPVYCGTKAAIHIFSKALRYQLQRVKVFEIIPPLVDTQMTAGRGRNKISPQQLASEFIDAFRRDVFEVNIGKVKLLKLINRISPSLAERIMKNG
jgi:uncharacterized oxidoreductase